MTSTAVTKPSVQSLLGALLHNELSADEFQRWFNQLSGHDKLMLLDQLDNRVNKEPAYGRRRC
jgi:hypothetical protein